MTVTPMRWASACVLACLVLGVLLLPPDPSPDQFAEWSPRWTAHEQTLTKQLNARQIHSRMLATAYQAASDADVARRVAAQLASASARNGPSIWFDSDVPASARSRVSQLIAAEQTSRGSWRGKSPVGVLVFTDTAATLAGARLPWGFNGPLIASTTMLRATPGADGRFMAVVRIGRRVLRGEDSIPSDRHLLDGCAFYDAFGSPGAQIRAWMDSSTAGFGRDLSFAPPDSATVKQSRWGFYDFWYSDWRFARCAGNDLPECSALLRMPTVSWQWRWANDLSVPVPAEPQAYNYPTPGFNATLLDAMVREIGPERFERVWQSPKSIDSAYFDVTGESLASWVHRRAVTLDGPYHIGPLPTTTTAILTIVTIACALALSARFARRPVSA